ncbi:MAG: S46 family peptidase [Bacteroidales bacterium]|nr:S46 family peptidase [Bacteroidales bacterium]
MMKKFIFSLWIVFLPFRFLLAGEGMWIPMLLQQLNEKEMKEMGMKISAEDIYSINNSSMKDAIVLFGRGCTGEIVSDQGLLLTNHHCGFGQIQKHSSVENDYLTNGFWAMNKSEELPNPGLTVTMLVKMEEVTNQILEGVTADMSEAQRTAKIRENTKKLTDSAAKESGLDVMVRPFYHGNEYYMFYNQLFKDIRLVGAPPSNIGKFGGDTDNWMWPRHTGDFSVFRIYVDKEGKPAEYHADNVPYKPAYHFPMSLKGVDEGDFTFVFGYPARTNQYLPAQALRLITEVSNPERVLIRGTRLEIFKQYANADPKVRIQYAAKDASVANAWKKMIGESKGLKRLNGIEKKQKLEEEFMQWAKMDPAFEQAYSGIIPAFNKNYEQLEKLTLASDYINECGLGIEVFAFALRFRPLLEEASKGKPDDKKMEELTDGLRKLSNDFFKDYHQAVDQDVAKALLKLYLSKQPEGFRPDFLETINGKFKGNVDAYVQNLFSKSLFVSQEAVNKLLEGFNPKKLRLIERDPAFQASASMRDFFEQNLQHPMRDLTASNDSLQRLYMRGLMDMQTNRRFYPDANFTLRVTYGKVEGYAPADAVYYRHFTTLEGIMEKENPDIYDYVVEDRLKELYLNKDYGDYADKDGLIRVAFAASNHTTGGNSGSPVLNAEGHMVGINFDRCWEGTMSDLMYDPAMSRNISIDVRYLLFIIDKFAGAKHLVDEMTIIR